MLRKSLASVIAAALIISAPGPFAASAAAQAFTRGASTPVTLAPSMGAIGAAAMPTGTLSLTPLTPAANLSASQAQTAAPVEIPAIAAPISAAANAEALSVLAEPGVTADPSKASEALNLTFDNSRTISGESSVLAQPSAASTQHLERTASGKMTDAEVRRSRLGTIKNMLILIGAERKETKSQNGGLIAEVGIAAAIATVLGAIFSPTFRENLKRFGRAITTAIGLGARKLETPEVLAEQLQKELETMEKGFSDLVTETSTQVARLEGQITDLKAKSAKLQSTIDEILTDSDTKNDGAADKFQAEKNVIDNQIKQMEGSLEGARKAFEEAKLERQRFEAVKAEKIAAAKAKLSQAQQAKFEQKMADLKKKNNSGTTGKIEDRLGDKVNEEVAKGKGASESVNTSADEIARKAGEEKAEKDRADQIAKRKGELEEIAKQKKGQNGGGIEQSYQRTLYVLAGASGVIAILAGPAVALGMAASIGLLTLIDDLAVMRRGGTFANDDRPHKFVSFGIGTGLAGLALMIFGGAGLIALAPAALTFLLAGARMVIRIKANTLGQNGDLTAKKLETSEALAALIKGQITNLKAKSAELQERIELNILSDLDDENNLQAEKKGVDAQIKQLEADLAGAQQAKFEQKKGQNGAAVDMRTRAADILAGMAAVGLVWVSPIIALGATVVLGAITILDDHAYAPSKFATLGNFAGVAGLGFALASGYGLIALTPSILFFTLAGVHQLIRDSKAKNQDQDDATAVSPTRKLLAGLLGVAVTLGLHPMSGVFIALGTGLLMWLAAGSPKNAERRAKIIHFGIGTAVASSALMLIFGVFNPLLYMPLGLSVLVARLYDMAKKADAPKNDSLKTPEALAVDFYSRSVSSANPRLNVDIFTTISEEKETTISELQETLDRTTDPEQVFALKEALATTRRDLESARKTLQSSRAELALIEAERAVKLKAIRDDLSSADLARFDAALAKLENSETKVADAKSQNGALLEHFSPIAAGIGAFLGFLIGSVPRRNGWGWDMPGAVVGAVIGALVVSGIAAILVSTAPHAVLAGLSAIALGALMGLIRAFNNRKGQNGGMVGAPNDKTQDSKENQLLLRATRVPAALGGVSAAAMGAIFGLKGGAVAAVIGSSLGVVGAVLGGILGLSAGFWIGMTLGAKKGGVPGLLFALLAASVGTVAIGFGGFIGGAALGALALAKGGVIGAAVGVLALAPIGAALAGLAAAGYDVTKHPEKYPKLWEKMQKGQNGGMVGSPSPAAAPQAHFQQVSDMLQTLLGLIRKDVIAGAVYSASPENMEKKLQDWRENLQRTSVIFIPDPQASALLRALADHVLSATLAEAQRAMNYSEFDAKVSTLLADFKSAIVASRDFQQLEANVRAVGKAPVATSSRAAATGKALAWLIDNVIWWLPLSVFILASKIPSLGITQPFAMTLVYAGATALALGFLTKKLDTFGGTFARAVTGALAGLILGLVACSNGLIAPLWLFMLLGAGTGALAYTLGRLARRARR